MSANPTTYQYEPLRVPQNWGAEEKKLILQLTDIFDDIYRRYGRLRFEDMGNVFRNRIISDEGNISEIEQTAENILLEVGTDKVYRALSEAVLIAELGARVPPVPMAVNLVWYDTTNKLMKRCTAVGPPIVWEVLQTNEVHTSHIDIQDNSIDIGSTGEINIESGGSINLSASSDLTVGTDTLADLLAGAGGVQTTIFYQDNQPTATATGDIWYDTDASPVTIKRWSGSAWVDITTTALAQALSAASTAQSTADGKIISFAQNDAPSATAVGDLWVDTNDNNKLYRATAAGTGNWVLYKVASGYVSTSYITIDNDSIDIVSGGSLNLSAASQITIGTNPFEIGSANYFANTTSYTVFSSVTIFGRNADDYLNGFYLLGPGSADGVLRLDNVITGNGYWTVSFDVRGTQGLALPVIVDICDSAATGFYTTADDAYTRKTLTINVTNWSSGVFHFVDISGLAYAYYKFRNIKIEKGTIATDWSENPGELHNSSITIDSAGIDIKSGSNLVATAPTTLKITSGETDATAIAIRNDTDYFISAGDLTQADAPFYVKKDGSVKATSGLIGGFNINAGYLYGGPVTGTEVVLNPSASTPYIAVGDSYLMDNGTGFVLGNSEAGGSYVSAIYSPNNILLIEARTSYIQMGYSDSSIITMEKDVYVNGDVTADNYYDHTVAFEGKALESLSAVKSDGKGKIDHSTLPEFARAIIRKPPLRGSIPKNKDGSLDYSKAPPTVEEEGRDLGAMISILTKAVQELTEITQAQQKQINGLLGVKT